jgi:hypothetical protein
MQRRPGITRVKSAGRQAPKTNGLLRAKTAEFKSGLL